MIEGGGAFFLPEILEAVGDLGGGVQFRQVAVDEFLDQLALAAEFQVAGDAVEDEFADAGLLLLVGVVETSEEGEDVLDVNDVAVDQLQLEVYVGEYGGFLLGGVRLDLVVEV